MLRYFLCNLLRSVLIANNDNHNNDVVTMPMLSMPPNHNNNNNNGICLNWMHRWYEQFVALFMTTKGEEQKATFSMPFHAKTGKRIN